MAETQSQMLPLGTQAPPFHLYDVISEKNKTLQEVKGSKGLVVMFICAHCPYVIKIEKKIAEIAAAYSQKGIGFVAICSNDVVQSPRDSPKDLKKQAKKNNFVFPYLHDPTQEIAKKYQAACTPDFYLFDAQLKCKYRGRFDDSTPGNTLPPSGKDLVDAMDALLSQNPCATRQMPSIGCNIKWK